MPPQHSCRTACGCECIDEAAIVRFDTHDSIAEYFEKLRNYVMDDTGIDITDDSPAKDVVAALIHDAEIFGYRIHNLGYTLKEEINSGNTSVRKAMQIFRAMRRFDRTMCPAAYEVPNIDHAGKDEYVIKTMTDELKFKPLMRFPASSLYSVYYGQHPKFYDDAFEKAFLQTFNEMKEEKRIPACLSLSNYAENIDQDMIETAYAYAQGD